MIWTGGGGLYILLLRKGIVKRCPIRLIRHEGTTDNVLIS